jgi:hypothetical protein
LGHQLIFFIHFITPLLLYFHQKALTSGTFKECEDYQKKDEVEQEKLGICVDYEIREQ